jgi:uncharacterized protein YcfJ
MRNSSILAVTIIAMLTLGGCTTTDRYGRTQTRVPVGAALGAVTGGLLGSQVGKGNGKIASAAIGAAVGGYAGNEIQNQQEATPRRY